MIQNPAALLGPNGPFARRLPHFIPRIQQQEMAAAVDRILEEGGLLVTEAGTGTGKTFAYLTPVLHGDGKVVISTGTKALQDQLFHRDIPVVRQALASPLRIALLKGRGNYLCLQRLQQAECSREAAVPQIAARLQMVRAWAGRTRTGEIAEVIDIPDNDPFWSQVTSTADNCLGQECPVYAECHVVKARRAAQESDVLVINHHLLFSDILLRQEGFGELLPEARAFILDEAHQLPGIASHVFGAALSGRQVTELARDSLRALYAVGADMPQLEADARRLERSVASVIGVFGAGRRQASWPSGPAGAEFNAEMHRLQEDLASLQACLEDAAARDKSLESCWRRGQALLSRLQLFAEDGDADDEGDSGQDNGQIKWFESTGRGFTLYRTPMDFSRMFRESIARYRSAWVFTSATLAVGEGFEHFTSRLGIEDAATARWGSPFDYRTHALLYLPEAMPEPGTRNYTAAVVDAVCPMIEASGGRAFVLFTSHQALQEAARLFANLKLEYPVFVQGSMSPNELLERFRSAGNGILLGTGSFWEGVDVRGPALSCVIIDKLPFASPDDPVFQARAALIKRSGGNPFRDHQLPAAIITLKQGIGRLIRDIDDYGVLMICDPRLLTRGYGRSFLANLPEMPRTRALTEVVAFFESERARAVS